MAICQTVVWRTVPLWALENSEVDLQLLQIKARNKSAVSEFYMYVGSEYKEYVKFLTDGLKYLTM